MVNFMLLALIIFWSNEKKNHIFFLQSRPLIVGCSRVVRCTSTLESTCFIVTHNSTKLMTVRAVKNVYYIGSVSFINHQKNESFLTRIIRSRNLLPWIEIRGVVI